VASLVEDARRWRAARASDDALDPIVVDGIPEASDEYDSYLGSLTKKLREGTDARRKPS
jgi:hypothetical protein